MSMPTSEFQEITWAHPWALAEQESWDNLYETCTAAALGYEKDIAYCKSTLLVCTDRCRTKSDVSEETASTVETLQARDDEMMANEVVIDSFSQALSSGDEEQQNALDGIIEHMQMMCGTQQGSLLVQSALAVATGKHIEALTAKLSSFLIDACKSPHGNHVVQKCLEVLGHENAQFIVDAVRNNAVALARHRFGCRIMQHLVDVCPVEQVSALIDEMMQDAARLCRHPFANYVMQSVVKTATAMRCHEMADVLFADAPGFARHRFAKHVFQLTVLHGDPSDQTRLVAASKRPMDFFKM